MRAIGMVLVVIGIIGVIWGGISWTRDDTVIDAGPIEVTAEKRESIPLPPIVGAVLLIGGVLLVAKGK